MAVTDTVAHPVAVAKGVKVNDTELQVVLDGDTVCDAVVVTGAVAVVDGHCVAVPLPVPEAVGVSEPRVAVPLAVATALPVGDAELVAEPLRVSCVTVPLAVPLEDATPVDDPVLEAVARAVPVDEAVAE